MKERAIELAMDLQNVLDCIFDEEFRIDIIQRLDNNDYIGLDLLEED